jgi:hypothetical protein
MLPPDTLRVTYRTLAEGDSLLDLIRGDRCHRSGYLTTDSVMSSHGLPVLHDGETGQALGVTECDDITVDIYESTDDVTGRDIQRMLTADEMKIVEAARRAGYTVRV